MTSGADTAVAPAVAPASPAGAAGSPNIPSYASASLYVGDLAPDVTEGMLFETFNAVGPVASIRVCRDVVTRRSLGYAYVNFHSVLDAERALDQLNNTPIKGRNCRVMWSQRDPAVRKSGEGNIFIKNLDLSIDHKTLHDTFAVFGKILSCKVAIDRESGESKGYGFVHFETAAAAQAAIEKVNNMMLAGKQVTVAKFVPKKERDANSQGAAFTNLYVKNLPESIDGEDQLKALFAEFGEITSVFLAAPSAVPKKKAVAAVPLTGDAAVDEAAAAAAKAEAEAAAAAEEPKVSRFGFVNFAEPEAAAKAVAALNEKVVEEEKDGVPARLMYVGRAQKKSEREADLRARNEALKLERMQKYQGVNVYVKNIDDTIGEEALRAEFEPFGSITSARVMVDERGVSRGFGFVCFSTPDEATRAVTEMNGRMLGAKPLYVALAQRRDVRQAQLEQHHARRAAKPGVGALGGGMMPGQAGLMGGYGVPLGYGGVGAVPGGFVQQGMAPFMYGQGRAAPGQFGVPAGALPVAGGRGGAPAWPVNAGAMAGGYGGYQMPMGGAPQRGAPRQAAPMRAAVPVQAIVAAPLDAKAIAQLPPDQQKLVVGEKLYPLIAATQPDLAGKLTGMLLDSYFTEELIHLMETPDALAAKIEEGLAVLREHAAQNQ